MKKNNIAGLGKKVREEMNQIMCLMTHIFDVFDALERSVDSEVLLAFNKGNGSPLQVT
ncbi:hypothetical protein KAI56_03435 [Candidatus Parcubacteria bacterium]|nr:hypothetical protein [Candidatus Parcubacteria bacterium]